MQYTRIALRPGLRTAGTRCKGCTHCKDPLQGMDPLQRLHPCSRSDLLQGTFAREFDHASLAARVGPAARHRPAATNGLIAKARSAAKPRPAARLGLAAKAGCAATASELSLRKPQAIPLALHLSPRCRVRCMQTLQRQNE